MTGLLYNYALILSIGFQMWILIDASTRTLHRHRRFQSVDFLFNKNDDPDTSGCPPTATIEQYNPSVYMRAHHGLFKDIPWTKEERLQIRDLHSTNQYHLLGPLLKQKLKDTHVSSNLKLEIATFFLKSYPPKEVRQLQSNENKCAIRAELALQYPNMTFINNLFIQQIQASESTAYKVIQDYFITHMTSQNE